MNNNTDTVQNAVEKLCLFIEVTSALFGTFGNILVFLSVLSIPKLRTPGNMFILNLTIADLIVTAISQPINAIGQLRKQEYYDSNPGVCQFIAVACTIACAVSYSTIGWISVNRYVYICHNHVYAKLFNWGTVPFMMVGLWIVGLLIDMPLLVGWAHHGFDIKINFCLWDRIFQPNYPIVYGAAISFWVTVTLYCYGNIYYWVSAQRKRSSLARSSNDADVALAKTLFVIFIVYLINWLPFAGVLLIDRRNQAPPIAYLLTLMLAHFNSSLNALIYGVSNKTFRAAYRSVLCRLFCYKQSELPGSSMKTTANNQIYPATINLPVSSARLPSAR